QYFLVVYLSCDLVGFVDNTVDGRTLGGLRFLAQQLEGLLQSADLLFGFFKVGFEGRGQIAVRGLLDHVWQRLLDLILRVIDVLQDVQVKVVHRFNFFREEAHDAYSRLRVKSRGTIKTSPICSGAWRMPRKTSACVG